MTPFKQLAALPFVVTEAGVEVLLVSTRASGRWTIPKGWPKPGKADADLAAREAFEEAGVAGEMSPQALGAFHYSKRLHFLSWAHCRVEVYPLRVQCQHLVWPEKASRRILWASLAEAASLVRDRDLARMLRDLADDGLPT
jgi:8-oxo-dGTP pyrophosphatase MutT (NUDIX family)